MNLWRMVLKVIVILSLAIVSRTALAGCSVGKYGYLTASFPVTAFTVAQNKTPGELIGSIALQGTGPNSSYLSRVGCSGRSFYFYQQYSRGMALSDYPGIYKTSVNGVGMKLTSSTGGAVVGMTANKWYSWYNGYGCTNCDLYATSSNFTLEFYAIGPVGTGDISMSGYYVQGYVNDSDRAGSTSGYFSINGTVKFKAGSCKTPDISVNLGKHSADSFTSVGSTSAPVPFNFQINECDPGLATVSYTFKPASGVTLEGAAGSEYLTLKGSQKAGGIGVQMFYDDGVTPVPFNSKTAFSGYETTTGGSYVIPMQARYVRTGKVSAGPANSAVEFVMAYE